VSDPLAKALILLVLAILARIPTIAHGHRKVQDRLRHARVAAPSRPAQGAGGAAGQQALTGVAPEGIGPCPGGTTWREAYGGNTTGRLIPAWQRAAPGERDEKGRNVA
jgi:hypothetical protein